MRFNHVANRVDSQHFETFLDAPAVFVDFAIEAMTPDFADYGIDV